MFPDTNADGKVYIKLNDRFKMEVRSAAVNRTQFPIITKLQRVLLIKVIFSQAKA